MPGPDRAGRLSERQVLACLRRASAAFQRSGFLAGSPLKIQEEFRELHLFTSDEQLEAIDHVLNEVSVEHYRGPHPPRHLAGEPKFRGCRMLEFVWHSNHFRKRMYFKFGLSGRHSDERLVVFSLHEEYKPNYFEKLD